MESVCRDVIQCRQEGKDKAKSLLRVSPLCSINGKRGKRGELDR